MAPLQPISPPLGLNAKFCMQAPTTLQMKEKVFSFSGDDFHVKTVDGLDVCVCKGKTLSLSDKKVFTDLQGNPIFTLKTKHLALFKSFYAEDASGAEVLTVKGHFSLGGSKSTCAFRNTASDGREVELEIKGDWFDRSAKIAVGGTPVASISRSFFNVREIFGDKQTYFVEVAPGVDLTLIAALCVCLDERENEK